MNWLIIGVIALVTYAYFVFKNMGEFHIDNGNIEEDQG